MSNDNKNTGKTTLFDKDELNVYDTVTLNTENLIDSIEEDNSVDAVNLTLDDFEQYNDAVDEDVDGIQDSLFYEGTKDLETDDFLTIDSDTNEDLTSAKMLHKDPFDEDKMLFEQVKDEIDTDKYQEGFQKELGYGKVKIMAIGIGGGGSNAIDRMYEEGMKNIELVAMDTSIQSLENIRADKKILIGESLLHGHGSGNDIEKAKEAFEASKADIQKLLEDIDMVFITGGIGRGTGSAGLVEVGKYAREMGVLTIGFATLPKVMEADMKVVEQYYELFTEAVDSNVIVENDKVAKVAYNLPINQAMKMADQMLVDGIRGISDLIINPGKINLDYADIKTAFSNQGSCIMGIGHASGEDLVVKAINNSINSDLVNIESLKTANTIIFNVSCARNTITIKEASDGTDLIYSRNASKDIQHMLFGYSYDDSLEGRVKVTFIATGTGAIDFDEYKNQQKPTFSSSSGLKTGTSFGDDIFTSVGGSSSSGPDFFN